jgi:rhodanese-related sulfurtransferase
MFFLRNDRRVNILRAAEYQRRFAQAAVPHILLDVRTAEEYEDAHIPGARNIPVQQLRARLNEVSRALPVIVYCRSGSRSSIAARILSDTGYTDVYDLGGFMQWVSHSLPVERAASH